jgi:hypothetical protein
MVCNAWNWPVCLFVHQDGHTLLIKEGGFMFPILLLKLSEDVDDDKVGILCGSINRFNEGLLFSQSFHDFVYFFVLNFGLLIGKTDLAIGSQIYLRCEGDGEAQNERMVADYLLQSPGTVWI